VTGDEAAARVANLLPSRFLRGYARGKLRSDPVYAAAADHLKGIDGPLFDLGCGVGLFEFYLRELGFTMPVTGIDHDQRKIAAARSIAGRYRDLDFTTGDARDTIPTGSNVVALDILHYFSDATQSQIVESIAGAVPAGGIAVIRDAVRDGSVRYRLTAAQETFSRMIRWLKAERLNFPTVDTIAGPFRRRGFAETIVPMWGRTPFNNYLFVFKRPASGTTNR
jgi:SAM-dependent methyltransferase